MTAQPLPALASGDPSAWDQALYAFLIEKGNRSGSKRTGRRAQVVGRGQGARCAGRGQSGQPGVNTRIDRAGQARGDRD
jgi:hypothetical protein